MATIDRSALLPYSSQQLFELVADIERYPDFLSGCSGATVLSDEDHTVTARLVLSRAGITHSFVTRNLMHPHDRIELTLVDGPFERFQGAWTFRALAEQACKVSLSLDFRLRSGLMHAAAGKLFDRVAIDLVDAVVKRASDMYGPGAYVS